MNFDRLSNRFMAFAEKECKGSSELYDHLSGEIADDPEILELASHARQGQPMPNLLFGAIHYLLLKGSNHPLKDYYASLTDEPLPSEKSFPSFKSFCMGNRANIIEILENKLVQTNEVRRCAYLFPTFTYIHEQAKRPLALIEIGTSAGFQLLWDHYEYHYGDGMVYGQESSEVKIHSEQKGILRPVFNSEIPSVTVRYGLDLHINDVTNDEDALWMKALIWPEHHDRRRLFDATVRCMEENRGKITFSEGDGIALLKEIADQVPKDSVIVVFHTHVANQMSAEMKQKLLGTIEQIAGTQDIFHLYNNMEDRDLHLDSFVDGRKSHKLVAMTDGHGRWFEWKLEDEVETNTP
ncbi:DUF2332 domain-containing protein [Bacillus sp. B-jedd]|uniref:DUF2332 domain-containing protein n=1 Tax=Bacillus sp. B-jedd TaxID=1476857 RepID=UPI0005156908|nr:DUF2332 domain-containing protein [Bacillus sp. B-jedd]CEG27753.1 Hypothetical protein BN1002_02625 [Bacillus sp. B-jedd]